MSLSTPNASRKVATTDEISVTAGTDVYYCYEVTNSGNLTLYLHDLADSELGTLFASLPYTLTPGSSVDTVAAGLTISATITATTVNTATWTAYNPGPIDVVTATATATVTVLIPPPNIFVDPLAISSSQQPAVQTQHTLTISNTGGSDLTWEIVEAPAVAAAPASPAPLEGAKLFFHIVDDLGKSFLFMNVIGAVLCVVRKMGTR